MSIVSPQRKTPLRVIVYCGATALIAFGLLAFVATRGTGEVRRCGRVFQIPVPYTSIQIRSSENSTTFFTIGYPNLKDVFSRRGGSFGWGPAYQAGAGFSILSTQDERLSLIALVELRTTHFTEVEFRVSECGSRTCVTPSACSK
jgi:hypothetical protein